MNEAKGMDINMKNIMFVAVSEKMKEVALQVNSDMGLDIPVIVSSMEKSRDIVKSNPNINVFISRGKTAKLLQQFSGKTVVYVTCSTGDILEPIQRLTAYGIDKIAVVASPFLIGEGFYDYKVGNTEIYIRPYELEELDKLVFKLEKQGIRGVVAGSTAIRAAKKYGMKVEPLDTKKVSIKRAIDEAIGIVKSKENEYLQEKKRAEEIRQYASKLYSAIEQSNAAVEELASSSEELASMSQETANIITKAFKEVNNTSSILEIIQQVAKRTNLLGLNAAIESSRAGEYGRSFSIVASEIRKLSAESKVSASKIGAMLNGLRNSVEFVLKNVEQSNAITQEQAQASQNIAHMLEELNNVGGKLIDMMKK
ncbi:PrpR N-terminal domain-containing protein [Clostridium sp. AWRP]|uniref:PrpR N-terminal domain-containing protein n=1 Tax=Clostridium sp. AWRP TaxID=2212991 RepID=UPI001FA9DC1C|nr:PrpR N-terminal domain-containing protein [Clostridium sp. AWRP]